MKEIISTRNAPGAIGPYSQAVKAGGFVFASGQIPLNPATGAIEAQDIAGQVTQVLENVRAVLEAAGTGLEKVVKTTVFLRNMGDFAAMNEIYASFFRKDCPARSAVEVAALPKGALVEIEVIAIAE
ncbi:MAG: RidA family protein [Oscillospiraceae bacterium]|jgi:2-iminobutanoate/2-iminopropanoate deaminase|nr:RidA family protein [Oscillospiraceae bacterium]